MAKKKKNKGKKQKKSTSLGTSMAQTLEEFLRQPTISEKWEERKERYNKSAEDNLTFDYKTNEQLVIKEAIVPALALWKFIKRHASEQYTHFRTEKGIEERKNFLQSFIGSNNRYVRLVAMIELMPITIWRRILWRTNIDFVSYESFFRRLQPEHWLAIESNFVDLQNGQTPRILTAKEAKQAEFQPAALAAATEGNPFLRHVSKPAWTKNLFSFDFGFNKYPGGKDNDSPILSTADRRRLHSSDNSKDFVVDTEFGRYMRLYRSARSNYVIRPNEDVELKTHICPGYWATILIHLLFWVISPAMAAVMLATASSNNLLWWANVLLGIPAAVTPLWLLCAGVKFSWIKANSWIDNRGTKWVRAGLNYLERLFDEHPRRCEIALAALVSLVVGSIATVGFAAILKLPNGLVAGLAAAAYTGYRFSRIGKTEKPMPMDLFIPLYLACLYLGGLLAIKWSPHLVKWLGLVAKYAIILFTRWIPHALSETLAFLAWVWMHASNFVAVYVLPTLKYLLLGMLSVGFLWLLLLVPLALMGIVYFAYCRLPKETQTDIDYLVEKLCFYSTIGIAGLMLLACVITARWNGLGLLSAESLAGVVILGIFSSIAAASTRSMAQKLNPEIQQLKEENWSMRGNLRLYGKFDHRYMVENAWFKTLPLEEKTELAKMIDSFVSSYIPTNLEGTAIALFMKQIRSFQAMERIKDAWESFTNASGEDRLSIIEIMLKKPVDFDEAHRLLCKQKERSKKNAKVAIILAKTVFAPIYFPCLALWWLGSKICVGLQHVLDFRRMAKAIRDFCPYIVKSEILE